MKTNVCILVVVAIIWAILFFLKPAAAQTVQQDLCRVEMSAGKVQETCLDGEVFPALIEYDENDCFAGDIAVKTSSDLAFLQGQACVAGDVEISGRLAFGRKVFTALDLGLLEGVGGTLFIRLNPRLNNIKYLPSLKANRAVVENNPMLPKSRATAFVEAVAVDGRRIEQLNTP